MKQDKKYKLTITQERYLKAYAEVRGLALDTNGNIDTKYRVGRILIDGFYCEKDRRFLNRIPKRVEIPNWKTSPEI